MKRLYIARDNIEASLLLDLLAQAFIPAKIENVHQASGIGDLAVNYPEIWIKRPQDFPRAKAVIVKFEYANKQPLAEVSCTQCAEDNPVSFDLCWSCGADLPTLSTENLAVQQR